MSAILKHMTGTGTANIKVTVQLARRNDGHVGWDSPSNHDKHYATTKRD